MAQKKQAYLACGLLLAAVMTGCSSLLPVAKTDVESPWETFEQAKEAFDKIIPYQTGRGQLVELQFDPFKTPNIRIMTYLDIIQRFMPNSSIKLENMAQGIQDCIAAGDNCQAYEINLNKLKSQRYGNVLLDLFRFKRQAHQTGWNFSALVIMINEVAVYKIWGGQPKIDEYLYKKNPLGPLQEPAEVVKDASIISVF